MARAPASDFAEFPDAFPASSDNAKLQYRRSDTHFAVHERKPSSRATIALRPEAIAIYPLSRRREFSDALQSTPVYALEPGGRMAVPTGRVFVRLAPKELFKDHADSFRKAGYEIAETVSYAPNAGWVRSTTSIASALSGVSRLARLPAVENVEPQMLTKAARKI